MSKSFRLFSTLSAAQDAGHTADATQFRIASKNPGESGVRSWSDWFPISATVTAENPNKLIMIQFRRSEADTLPMVFAAHPGDVVDGIYRGPIKVYQGLAVQDTDKLILADASSARESAEPVPPHEPAAPAETLSPSEPSKDEDAGAKLYAEKFAPGPEGEGEDGLRATVIAAAENNGGKKRGKAAAPSKGRGISAILKDIEAIQGRFDARGAEMATLTTKLRELQTEQARDGKALATLTAEALDAQRQTAEALTALL